MKRRRLFVLFILLQVILLAVAVSAPVTAAPVDKGKQNKCVPHESINNFNNIRQIEAQGFFLDLFGSGDLSFHRDDGQHYASLHLGTDYSGDYMASRITEVDDSFPVGERIKCWQPTADQDVIVEFTVRFEQADTPPGLTENILLWNAPFGEEESIPTTAFGVSRNQAFPGYIATVSQSVTFFPVFSGLITTAPMPDWLDATEWHDVRMTVGQYNVVVEVAQGENDFTTVLDTTLPEAVEPLAFEFSVDNEVLPGFTAPVTEPDTLDVAYWSASLD